MLICFVFPKDIFCNLAGFQGSSCRYQHDIDSMSFLTELCSPAMYRVFSSLPGTVSMCTATRHIDTTLPGLQYMAPKSAQR